MPGPHDPSCPCAIRRKVLSICRSIIAYFEGERKGKRVQSEECRGKREEYLPQAQWSPALEKGGYKKDKGAEKSHLTP